jgi:large subunit ribosomal protein L4
MATKIVKTVKKVKKVVAKKEVVKKVIKAKAVIKSEVKKVPTLPKLRGVNKIEAKVAISSPAKGESLNASILDLEGKVSGHIQLPQEIFNAKINKSLMSQAVRVYLINQRQGTSKTKHRGEVDRTTKKIYQQKGTGRARHGSRRAPIFVGGGKVFGPTPRDLSLGISKKMKTLALFSALSSKLKDNEIKIVKGLETILPKTKLMAQVLEKLEIKTPAKVLLVLSGSKGTENINRASRNIKGVEIFYANSLNTYKVLDNRVVLFMKEAIDILKNTFLNK